MTQYKEKLQEELKRLLKEIEENSKPEDYGDDTEGESMEEEADEGEAMANQLAANQALKNRVNEIEEALRRIDAGTYGTCVECGNAISKDVLDAAPESSLCADCKKK